MDDVEVIEMVATAMVVEQTHRDKLARCKEIIRNLLRESKDSATTTVAMLATLGLAFVNKELGGKE